MPNEGGNKVMLLASVVAAIMDNLETVEAGTYATRETRRGVVGDSITCISDLTAHYMSLLLFV